MTRPTPPLSSSAADTSPRAGRSSSRVPRSPPTGAARGGRPTGRDAASASSGSPPRRTPGRPTRRWDHVADWPPRGSLANDAGILAMVAAGTSRRGRLLWAEDALRRRVVLAADVRPPRAPRGRCSASGWAPAGTPPRDLVDETGLGRLARDDVTVSRWSCGPWSPRPGRRRWSCSPGRRWGRRRTRGRSGRPGRALSCGRGRRSGWREALGAVRLAGHVGPAARVRCGRYDGPVLGAQAAMLPPPSTAAGPDSFADEMRWLVAAVTGLSPETWTRGWSSTRPSRAALSRHTRPGVLGPTAA